MYGMGKWELAFLGIQNPLFCFIYLMLKSCLQSHVHLYLHYYMAIKRRLQSLFCVANANEILTFFWPKDTYLFLLTHRSSFYIASSLTVHFKGCSVW